MNISCQCSILYINRYTIIYNTRERDDTMAATSKPVNGAFVLNSNKVTEFLTKKANTSSDAIKRFDCRKSKTAK